MNNTCPILTAYLLARYEAEQSDAKIKALEAEKAEILANTPEWMFKAFAELDALIAKDASDEPSNEG